MLYSQINENYLWIWQSELNNFITPFTYSQKRGSICGGVFDNFSSVLKISPFTFSLPNFFRIFPQNFQKFFVRFESSKIGTKNERLPLCRSRRSLGYSVLALPKSELVGTDSVGNVRRLEFQFILRLNIAVPPSHTSSERATFFSSPQTCCMHIVLPSALTVLAFYRQYDSAYGTKNSKV